MTCIQHVNASVSESVSNIILCFAAAEWEVPVGTIFAGNNITARTQTHNVKPSPGSYVDLGIRLPHGILQSFQFYIHNPNRVLAQQRVKFLIWQLNYQEFTGQTNELYNSSVTLKYELEFTLNTQSGAYTVSPSASLSLQAR